jgi:hypothetical protein
MMPTPFVLNDAVVIKQKISLANYSCSHSYCYSKPTFTKNHVQFEEEGYKGKRQYQVSKICEAAIIKRKGTRRIIIANDRVKTQ